MSGAALLAFTAAAVLLTVTPGLDTMMLSRMVLGGGGRAGVVGGFGTTLGCLVWGAASIAGLTGLLVGIHVGVGQLWRLVVVRLAGRAAVVLSKPRVKEWAERLTASVLIGFGLKVAFDTSARG